MFLLTLCHHVFLFPKEVGRARLDFQSTVLTTVQLLIILPLLLKYRDFSVLGAGRRKGKSILSQECEVKTFFFPALPGAALTSHKLEGISGLMWNLLTFLFESLVC